MKNACFFQIQQIPDLSSIFDQFKQQNIYFSYFQVDQNYYLFLYAQQSIQLDFIYESIDVIQELDSKQRKIRSLRGFILYVLEIIEDGRDSEILKTNLQPFFWRKVKDIIRQNKKAALQEFLLGSQESIPSTEVQNDLKDKIESLENRVNSLQERIVKLENQNLVMEKKLNVLSAASRSPKFNTSRQKEYHTTFHQNHDQNFLSLRQIPEPEKIKIIQIGFRLNQEGKISLKNYYESEDPNSVFQSKGYLIKYEAIRKTNLYKELKPSNN